MKIDEPKPLPLLQELSYRQIARDGTACVQTEEVLTEHPLRLTVEGREPILFYCTPQNFHQMILGRLLTEGLIASMEDVQSLSISEDGRQASVRLRDCPRRKMEPVQPIPWSTEDIFALADRFAQGSPLHEKTWATHCCMLARGGELLFSCEDMGRHNALDKVLGWALMQRISLRECTVYSSGRVPTEIVRKAIMAGIPILCTKASPTAASIQMARDHRLTLICAARRDRMKVFTNLNTKGSLP